MVTAINYQETNHDYRKFQDNLKASTSIGAAIGAIGVVGTAFASAFENLGTMHNTLSQAAANLCDSAIHGISILEAHGVNQGVAMAAIMLAPIAISTVVSVTGRIAMQVKRDGLKQFWDNVTGVTADIKLRQGIENRVGHIEMAFKNGYEYIALTGHGDNAQFIRIDEKEYKAIRRSILTEASSIAIKGDKISQILGGKLTRVGEFISGKMSVDFRKCEVLVRDVQTNALTVGTANDYVSNATLSPAEKTHPWPVIINAPIQFSVAMTPHGAVYAMEGADAYSEYAQQLGFVRDQATGQWQRSHANQLTVEEIKSVIPGAVVEVKYLAGPALNYNSGRDRELVAEAFKATITPVPETAAETEPHMRARIRAELLAEMGISQNTPSTAQP